MEIALSHFICPTLSLEKEVFYGDSKRQP